MKIDFTKDEMNHIKSIIEGYRTVSSSLEEYRKKADDIQKKVISLENDLSGMKEEENILMKKLHDKYGNFNIQDIYDVIYNKL